MSNKAQLVKLLEKKYGKARLSGKDWIRIPCPTCNERDRRKMKRNLTASSNTSNCFICGVVLDVRDMLDGAYFPKPLTTEEKLAVEERVVDPRAFELPYHTFIPINELPAGHPAVKFLHKDHLFDLDSYWRNNRIVYVPAEGGKVFRQVKPYITSAERIVFPVYLGAKLMGWQMRSLPGTFYGDRPDCIKYYHLFDKGSHLYNYDQARKYKRVVVVEGIKKALKFPNAVATLGSGISDRQLHLIAGWEEIIMMLDGEDHNNTQTKALGIVEGLKAAGRDVINVDLRRYNAVSPDDLPADQLNWIADEEWNRQHAK
jgi:hypothetical protein